MREKPAKEEIMNASERANERLDLRAELDKLDAKLSELRILFEQYFSGVVNLPPDHVHKDIKRRLRTLMKAPFKSSAMNYRLRSIETRYNTLNTYWQRVLKQKEDGTYSKDVFKAEMRERLALEQARSETAVGKAERNMENLFTAYRVALEKQTGSKHNIDYSAFQKSLLQRAKDFKEKSGATKLSFKVVVKEGKVTVQIKGKKAQDAENQGQEPRS